MPDHTNDIDALLGYTQGIWPEKHAALTALVAERDALKQRVAELESNPPADRDRELRERLVESAMRKGEA
jgi:cell division protein FtsB